MSQETNGIATRQECNNIVAGTFPVTVPLNQCPTKGEISATGKLAIAGSYADNQCVRFTDLTSSTIPHIIFDPTSITYSEDGRTAYVIVDSVPTNLGIIGTQYLDYGNTYLDVIPSLSNTTPIQYRFTIGPSNHERREGRIEFKWIPNQTPVLDPNYKNTFSWKQDYTPWQFVFDSHYLSGPITGWNTTLNVTATDAWTLTPTFDGGRMSMTVSPLSGGAGTTQITVTLSYYEGTDPSITATLTGKLTNNTSITDICEFAVESGA